MYLSNSAFRGQQKDYYDGISECMHGRCAGEHLKPDSLVMTEDWRGERLARGCLLSLQEEGLELYDPARRGVKYPSCPNGWFLIFRHAGISFPNFVERSILKLPLSNLCALPLALLNRAPFEGGRSAKRCREKGEEEEWPPTGAKRKKGRMKTGQELFWGLEKKTINKTHMKKQVFPGRWRTEDQVILINSAEIMQCNSNAVRCQINSDKFEDVSNFLNGVCRPHTCPW